MKPNNLDTAIRSIIDSMDNAMNYEKPSILQGIPCGFHSLDKLWNGIKPTKLSVIAGRPASCKTLLLMQMAAYMAEKSYGAVIFCSASHSKEELSASLLSARSGVDIHNIENTHLVDEEWAKIQMAISSINDRSNLHFLEDFNIMRDSRRLETQLQELEEKGENTAAVIVDSAVARCDISNQNIKPIFASLKSIARENKCGVIASCAISLKEDAPLNRYPIIDDLNHVELIEDQADIVTLINRNIYTANESLDIRVLKNNCGKRGNLRLSFDTNSLRIGEL